VTRALAKDHGPRSSDGADLPDLFANQAPSEINERLVEAVRQIFAEGADPLRAVVLARSLSAVARLVPSLDDRDLGEAASAPSDVGVLLRTLEQPAAIDPVSQNDPLAEARLRGLAIREELLQAEGGMLTAEQTAKQLNLTRQAVDKRRQAGRLIAVSTGRRGYLYPSWQFTAQGVLPGLERVLSESSVKDPWMMMAFFLSGDARLEGRTPLEALRQDAVEAVTRAARGYGEHSAA
jgi:hypothetical protein